MTWVTDDKAAEQVTAVHVCFSAFVNGKLLDMSDEGRGRFNIRKCYKDIDPDIFKESVMISSCVHCHQNQLFLRRPQDISSRVCDKQNRYFKQNHDVFLTLKRFCWFFFCLFLPKPDQSISTALWQQEISICERIKKKMKIKKHNVGIHLWYCTLVLPGLEKEKHNESALMDVYMADKTW